MRLDADRASRRCAYFVTLKELRRRSKLLALDHIRSDLSLATDSVCNRGTADRFEQWFV
jgi:hypothetical protein